MPTTADPAGCKGLLLDSSRDAAYNNPRVSPDESGETLASRVRLGRLFDLYGAVLTEKQRLAYELHDVEDWSLAEIAEHLGVTRQGAHELVRRARERLLAMEESLGFDRREERLRQRWEALAELLENSRDQLPEDFLRRAEGLMRGNDSL